METANKTSDGQRIAPVIDFDTRMVLSAAEIDARLAHSHGLTLADARASLAAAEDEADMIRMNEPRFNPNPVLDRARKIIEASGWTKGQWTSNDGAVCALHAIRYAGEDNPRDCLQAEVELLNRIAATTGQMLSVPEWNDKQSDVADVIRLMY